MAVTVSVPGKINIMGEHAIVHGKPSLLTAINLRTYVTVESPKANVKGQHIEVKTSEPDEYVKKIVDVVRKELKLDNFPKIRITITSQIPAGYHLGSSAATAVGVTGALMYFLRNVWNPVRINEIAYEAEKLQHGTPSGGDNTAVTFGGLLWYRKELEFLRSMWQLPFAPHKDLNHFFLIDTGRPVETTGEMVAMVRSKVEHQKSEMERIFNKNEEQTRRVTVALKEGNEEELLDAVRIGERTLEYMGVVSTKAASLIRSIEHAGGAAKILGGGGRKDGVGYVLCYHHELKHIETVCRPYGFSLRSIRLGEEGIRLETKQ